MKGQGGTRDDISISLALMTHDEVEELVFLFATIAPFLHLFTEIVVVEDASGVSVQNLLSAYEPRVTRHALNGDFARQRNVLKGRCRGDYIFILDPDELPSSSLLEQLPSIVRRMKSVGADMCSVPRLNVIYDADLFVAPEAYAFDQMALDRQGDDYQTRLVRNAASVRWINKVHERVVGADVGLRLPNTIEFCLLHSKRRGRQETQNLLYDSISRYSLREQAKKMGLRPLARALRIVRDPKWIDYPEQETVP